MSRLSSCFKNLKSENRPAFISFIMAGDPTLDVSEAALAALPSAGVDVIEIGVPFTDPMADGPAIQRAGQRAIENGVTLRDVLALVSRFRETNAATPIVLMGYYNPIYALGVDAFLSAAVDAGVDGLIVVDLPPEEDEELCLPARAAGLDFIRLATPTTNDARLPIVLKNTSGFVYYVSITGVTGSAAADAAQIAPAVARLKAATDLPICVGFGVKTPEAAREIARIADGVVVGSAIIDKLAGNNPADGAGIAPVMDFVRGLAESTHSVETSTVEKPAATTS